MVERTGLRSIRIAFVPKGLHARVMLHAAAMVTGAVCAIRLGGGAWWSYAIWYVTAFVAFHFALIPFLAAGLMLQMRFERWVRAMVEQELIRFDLQTYERQLKRVFSSERPPRDGSKGS